MSTQPDLHAGTLELLVWQVRYEGRGINSYEFVDAEGAPLPAFTAGAHLDVHLKGDVIRQYPISNAPRERHRYVMPCCATKAAVADRKLCMSNYVQAISCA